MSYFTTLLTSTTSRYASFRRTLLSSSSEDDSSVDDPEASHVSRVLRAYYKEKNRPFPTWLGTDPRAVAQAQQPQQSFVGSAQGSLRGQSYNTPGSGNAGGGLGDIWADSPTGEQSQEEPGSLRRGIRQRPGIRGSEVGTQQQHQRSQSGEPLNVRQLPSQRDGSYQSQNQGYNQQQQGPGRNMSPVPPSSASSGGSVQERLKARLGGRSAATPSPPLRDLGGSGSEGGGSGAHNDRGARGRPYVGAGSPWSGGDEGYNGGVGVGHGYDGSGRRRDLPGYGMGPPVGQRPR